MDASAVQSLSAKNNGMMHPSTNSISKTTENVNGEISEGAGKKSVKVLHCHILYDVDIKKAPTV